MIKTGKDRGNPEFSFRHVNVGTRNYQPSILEEKKNATVFNASLKIRISQIELKTKYKYML